MHENPMCERGTCSLCFLGQRTGKKAKVSIYQPGQRFDSDFALRPGYENPYRLDLSFVSWILFISPKVKSERQRVVSFSTLLLFFWKSLQQRYGSYVEIPFPWFTIHQISAKEETRRRMRIQMISLSLGIFPRVLMHYEQAGILLIVIFDLRAGLTCIHMRAVKKSSRLQSLSLKGAFTLRA